MANARLLIVDDEVINLKALNELLKHQYDISVATDAEQALEIFRDLEPDIILLDIMLPDTNGIDLCKQLIHEASGRYLPVIFISSLSAPSDEEAALKAGGVDYVTKPFSPALVKARLKTHLELSQLRRSITQIRQALPNLDN